MQSARYILSPICLSICLSTSPSVTRVDQSKTVEVRIMQLSPPIALVFVKLFSSFVHRYLENCTGYDQSYYKYLIGNCICTFDWHQSGWPWM